MLEAQLRFQDRCSKPGCEVDDPGYGAGFDCVSASWIAVSFGQDAESLEAGDAVLDTHPEAVQSMVIGAFILCQGTCLVFSCTGYRCRNDNPEALDNHCRRRHGKTLAGGPRLRTSRL